ncbi:MAG: hypothetical protein COY40_02630 [Alphaproteobacteria bacterium CG_4_10_14_0_8_um_filter_53_9]|nr:MAG: hypothetical protein COY40_02630 [Alphaproteobacteria bacterium CG_4_10_14_0_8_um_filter_53_9]
MQSHEEMMMETATPELPCPHAMKEAPTAKKDMTLGDCLGVDKMAPGDMMVLKVIKLSDMPISFAALVPVTYGVLLPVQVRGPPEGVVLSDIPHISTPILLSTRRFRI